MCLVLVVVLVILIVQILSIRIKKLRPPISSHWCYQSADDLKTVTPPRFLFKALPLEFNSKKLAKELEIKFSLL